MTPDTLPPSAGGPDAASADRLDPHAFIELLNRYFECTAGARCDPLGAHRLRGVGAPVEVFAPCHGRRHP